MGLSGIQSFTRCRGRCAFISVMTFGKAYLRCSASRPERGISFREKKASTRWNERFICMAVCDGRLESL